MAENEQQIQQGGETEVSPAAGKPRKLQAHLNAVINELQQAQHGTAKRQELIKKIEAMEPDKARRLVVYVASATNQNGAVGPPDVPPIGDALAQIGRAKNLDLLIHTFGGSGEIAEKIVEMCRSHCEGEFRVIIPNMAKSAGTLIALGADRIIMGHCSEVGPIDPQIRTMVGGLPQLVSAWTFIRARDELEKKVNDAISKGQNPAPYLQQLAGIDPVFVKHCEQLMTFARRLGQKWIAGRLRAKGIETAETQADKVVDFLSNVEQHVMHGRLILARQFKAGCQPPLDIVELEETDEFWQLIWELYIRSEVFLMLPNPPPMPPKAKVIETANLTFTIA